MKWIVSIVFGMVLFGVPLFTGKAFGAHENGNGGNIVYCKPSRDRGIFQYEQTMFLLDYLEGKKLRGLNFNIADPQSGSPRVWKLEELRQYILGAFIARVENFDPAMAENLKLQLKNFFNEALVVDLDLAPVDDSLHVGIPPGCEIYQAAVQKTPVFPEDRRFLISKSTWPVKYERSPCNSDFCIYPPDEFVQQLHYGRAEFQAGLMIHEVLLRRALELGQTDSVRVRYFNSYVMSQKFLLLNQEGWIELRRLTGL